MSRLQRSLILGRGLLIAVVLQSCAAVDQFGGRIEDANRNSQYASDQETLLNIVRAKYYRPLTFVAVSQVTGGQTETLTTGLPTITFGSGITPAQHIGQISNSVISQAQGGYQSNLLVSTAFQTGMLSAIPEATIAYLIAAHPRDPVLYSTIDAFIVKVVSTGKIYRLTNNPELDQRYDCPAVLQLEVDQSFFEASNGCNYSTFLRFANFVIEKGLTAEIVATTSTSKASSGTLASTRSGTGSSNSGSSAGSTDKAPTPAQGRFCFDATKSARFSAQPQCSLFNRGARKGSNVEFKYGPVGTVQLEMVVKSPLGVYALLGSVLRHPMPGDFPYGTVPGLALIGHEPFVNITNASARCFVDVSYVGEHYCVPAGSQNTPVLFDILQQLKNLSTTPSDLNAPFAVRFVGN